MKRKIFAVCMFAAVVIVLGIRIYLYVTNGPNTPAGVLASSAVFCVFGSWFAYSEWKLAQRREQWLARHAEQNSRHARHRHKAGSSVSNTFEDLLVAVEQNLKAAGFDISRDVALPTGDVAALVASRTEFTFHNVVNVPIILHLFVQHPRIAAAGDFDTLFEGGFQHVRSLYPSSFWQRPQFGHVILPCIAVDAATRELIAFASRKPHQRWRRFEFPVLYDLLTGRVFYYEKTPRLGAMFFPGARALANLAFDTARPVTDVPG